MKTSLGLLEVRGLALAILVADAMSKSAAVRLEGAESAKGGGWTLVKVTGDVAAVQAAVATGAALAERVGGLVSQKVLSRPDRKLMQVMVPQEPLQQPAPQQQPEVETKHEDLDTTIPAQPEIEHSPEPAAAAEAGDTLPADKPADPAPAAKPLAKVDAVVKAKASCNLCGDPKCPRRKGEPRSQCLHAGETQ